MNAMFSPEQFPSRQALRRGKWAPVLFTPNPDSADRLVIAVAAVGEDGFHVAVADAGKRFNCLFGPAAASALMVQEATASALRKALAAKGVDALSTSALPFSGVSLGLVREGQATSVQELAQGWLAATSSLHAPVKAETAEIEDFVETAIASIDAQANNDRLPVLVYKAVEQVDPELGGFFAADIRSRAAKGSRVPPQGIFIGFAGSHVVANFATLKPSRRPRGQVDHVKRLMWDLARYQDDEATRMTSKRAFEMIVFHRDSNDPEYDEDKHDMITAMMDDLWTQGSRNGIQLQPRTSVSSIADHVRLVERSAVLQ